MAGYVRAGGTGGVGATAGFEFSLHRGSLADLGATGGAEYEASLASSDSRLGYRLPRPAPDGRTELRLTPLELLERLSRLIPPPRLHRHRYHGVLAPNAKLRAAVIAIGRPDVDASEDEATAPVHDAASDNGPARAASRARIRWAVLLARVDRLSREDRTFFVTLLRQHARSERVRLISPFEFEEDVQSIVAGRSDREPEQTRALTRVPLAARYHLRTLDELLTRQDGEGTSH